MVFGRTESWSVMRASPTALRIAAALSVLSLAAVVYVVDRPASSLPAGLAALGIHARGLGVLGPFAGWFPTFAHAFAFALLTAVAVGSTSRIAGALACLAWLLVDGVFELAQHPTLSREIAPLARDRLADTLILDRTARYLAGGTFDLSDLASIVAGALAAFLVFLTTRWEHSS